ncbi:MAG: PIN domain-containing protein [Planctomycetaceae bacterium]
MKVLLDLNVVLDVILNRQPWVVDSLAVWNAQQSGEFEGFLAATEFTNLFYVVERIAGNSAARTAVDVCLNAFIVVPVDRTVLHAAETLSGTDFEDNVCIACAASVGADWIVTRDTTGFAQSSVPAIAPADLMKLLAK